MPQIVCNIALDVSVKDSGQVITAKQGDSKSRLLCVSFTDEKKPLLIEDGAAVLLNVARGEERYAYEGRVSGGKALFVIPDFALAAVGTVTCDASAVGSDGTRLTTASFTIVVEEAACPEGGLGGEEGIDLAASLLAEAVIQPLVPENDGADMVIAPAVNRKYALDLSDAAYVANGSWAPFRLALPTPEFPLRDNWILIYCHAPVSETAGAVGIDWGTASERLFADGEIPYITMGDFDIVCTYSPIAKKWQIGVIQYAVSEGTV